MSFTIEAADCRKRLGPQGPSQTDSASLQQMLLANGYVDIRQVSSMICALKQFNYATAIVVGLDDTGYSVRYCYEHASDARAALLAWDGRDHPSGPWIKCKGAGVDLLNPAFG